MAAISWKSAVSGNWSTGTLWVGNVVPAATSDVAIAVAGSYDVTVTTAHAAKTVTLNDANGSLEISNTLTMGGALTVTNGSLLLDAGGVLKNGTLGSLVVNAGTFTFGAGSTIEGGSVKIAGGTFNANGGTLSATKLLGALNLDQSSESLAVSGGLTGGVGAAINVSGDLAVLQFRSGNQTIDSTVISLGGSLGDSITQVGTSVAPSTLTLGAGVTVNHTGTLATITAAAANASDEIINKGLMRLVLAGGTMAIGGGAFVNQGTMNANLGDTLRITSSSFTNSAILNVTGGSTASVGAGTAFANTGTVNVTNNSTLTLNQAPTGAGKITATDSTVALLGTVTVAEVNMISSRAGAGGSPRGVSPQD